MNMKLAILAASSILLAGCAGQSDGKMAKKSMAHTHMGHVATGWKDTPDKMGLLPTAIAEAKIAQTHVGLALKKPDDLAWLKTHTAHVQHALDPTLAAKGPGLGYGVVKAAAGSAQHIGFASGGEDASKNVKAHSEHVAASTGNVVAWANEMVALSKDVMAASSAADAAAKVRKMQTLAAQLIDGTDANGDGKVIWIKGEGGLGQAEFHMGLMKKGEGMS